jgi:hypothetical protein
MAHRKNYYPNRVSRNERLAFQLLDDPKIHIVNFRDSERRRKNRKVTKHMMLGDFIRHRGEPIHLFSSDEKIRRK